jgi:hypothetical protein
MKGISMIMLSQIITIHAISSSIISTIYVVACNVHIQRIKFNGALLHDFQSYLNAIKFSK